MRQCQLPMLLILAIVGFNSFWMKKTVAIILVLFNVFLSFGGVHGDWKKIETDFYSLEIPSSWRNELKSDEPRVSIVASLGFRQYEIVWGTPWEKSSEWEKSLLMFVESYEALSGKTITLDEIEKMEITNASPGKVLEVESQQVEQGGTRICVVTEQTDYGGMQKKTFKAREYIQLYHDGTYIHSVKISVRDSFLKSNPEPMKIINGIFESFVLK